MKENYNKNMILLCKSCTRRHNEKYNMSLYFNYDIQEERELAFQWMRVHDKKYHSKKSPGYFTFKVL